MLFVLLMCCAILILNKFLFNELDKFEFITFPYFKKEPSLMRKLLLCTHYFFSFRPSWKASPTRSVTL